MPDPHAIFVLLLTLVALFLFTRNEIPIETSALLILCVLAVTFEVFPYPIDAGQFHAVDFFHGFGHEALIAVCGLMIVGAGIVQTGALEPVGRILASLWTKSPALSFLLTLLLAALLSAFINNTPIVVLLIPILVSVALRTGGNPSSVLMPMGFATLLGGMGTTIGTSTNLLVVTVATDLGLPQFGMFDFALPALMAGSVGIAFLLFIAPRLLPKRTLLLDENNQRVFTAHLVIPEGSFAADKSLGEIIAKTAGEMSVGKIRRTASTFLPPLSEMIIQADDRLLVHDTPEKLKEYEQTLGAQLYSGSKQVDDEHPLESKDQQLIEIIVHGRSPLKNRTLKKIRFIEQYKLVALAVHRGGEKIQSMPQGLGNLRLLEGDVLLVQGRRENIDALKAHHEFLVLDRQLDVAHTKNANLSLFIMLAVVVTAGFGILPIAVSAMVGALAMLLTGCLNWNQATRALSVSVIMIVVTSLALGLAMQVTGGSEWIADGFVSLTRGASPAIAISALIFLMAVFTNIISNNAAAVIGTPIAVSIAQSLGQPAEPFVLAVLFGANMSYATPMAYTTNLLIMSAGNYKFSDFLRVGIPLTLLMWLVYSLLLPMLYDLH
ncbi:MAG: TrkA-C domain protein [uncultured Thiotrichaceae bacterium]|uniref:TrkA-C domain protein n=1 Tax=uncultured Thiotrichaceae bacterium TaxID=298394 RepID=A0A6S6SXG5_9GAMM|nr:MAG: TrkA-C domain protein [uncultured Thiotrichaceae bacterium]